jgi:hypothetical protein
MADPFFLPLFFFRCSSEQTLTSWPLLERYWATCLYQSLIAHDARLQRISLPSAGNQSETKRQRNMFKSLNHTRLLRSSRLEQVANGYEIWVARESLSLAGATLGCLPERQAIELIGRSASQQHRPLENKPLELQERHTLLDRLRPFFIYIDRSLYFISVLRWNNG